MVDLAPLLALGKSLAAEAVRTAGTRVRFETRTTTTDPGELETRTTTVVLGEYPGIVTSAGNANAAPELLPGAEIRGGDWKITLLPATTPPPVGAWVVVVRSKDPNLTGMDGKVLGHASTSAGAVLAVFARPGRPS